MNKWHTTLLACALLQCACSNNSDRVTISKEISEADVMAESMPMCSYGLDSLICGIKDWEITDNGIFCMGHGNSNLFFMLDDSDSLSILWQAGEMGHGKNEYGHPNILKSHEGCFAYDDMRKTITEMDCESGETIGRHDFNTTLPPNGAFIIDFPIWGYVTYTPQENTLAIGDANTGVTYDKMVLPLGKSDMQHNNDFAWDYDGKSHIVIAFQGRKEFIVCDLSDDLKHIVRETTYKSKDAIVSPNTIYYTHVFAQDNCFYLLSQQNVNLETGEGTTLVEQYDYDGMAKRHIKLSIVADKVIDNGESLHFTSPMNDSIYIMKHE